MSNNFFDPELSNVLITTVIVTHFIRYIKHIIYKKKYIGIYKHKIINFQYYLHN